MFSVSTITLSSFFFFLYFMLSFFCCFPNSPFLFSLYFPCSAYLFSRLSFFSFLISLAMSLYFRSSFRPGASPLTTNCLSAAKPRIPPSFVSTLFLTAGFLQPWGEVHEQMRSTFQGGKQSHAIGSKFFYPVCSHVNNSLKRCFLSPFPVNETSADQDAFW